MLAQHLAADAQAVLDLRGGAHVQQRAQHLRVAADLQVDAAHRVGGVLLVGHPARGGAGGAAVGQREHAGAARLGGEGVGVDRHEQVGLHAPRLAHALGKWHEVVGVARDQRAHAGWH
jgi:hypothetical protein